MKIFEFSQNVIAKVIDELHDAQEYIRIAIFQLHDLDIFSVLDKKLKEGVRVEIFTLPYDSINEDVRNEVTNQFKDIKNKGATLYFCKWNVGDPQRTTTAIGRWYSFHGKFIVTDKSAIALSANFIQSRQLDAIIIYKNEQAKIDEYNVKFKELIKLFIVEHSGYEGIIRQKIVNTNLPAISNVFELPPVIKTRTHIKYWIYHYPLALCPVNIPIEEKLYLTPFDCRGRDFFTSLISEATDFVYISTESFTDPDFAMYLEKMSLKGLDIRILSGATSMDFTDRIQNIIRNLLAHNIKIRSTEEDIHAKLIITDKHLVVSSVNLNKMNLGFKIGTQFWRENTETISVCRDTEILKTAKNKFIDIYNRSIDIEIILAKKIESAIGSMFNSTLNLRSSREVKTLFAQLILKQEIQVKKLVLDIGKIITRLMNLSNKKVVEKKDFFLALILYYLSERKHDFDQLEEKLKTLDTHIDLKYYLTTLSEYNFIEKVEDYYKIKVENLF